jgi:hypothetical protein
MDRMNCVAEVATPSSRRSTLLCTARGAVGTISSEPSPVTVGKRATLAVEEPVSSFVSRQTPKVVAIVPKRLKGLTRRTRAKVWPPRISTGPSSRRRSA